MIVKNAIRFRVEPCKSDTFVKNAIPFQVEPCKGDTFVAQDAYQNSKTTP